MDYCIDLPLDANGKPVNIDDIVTIGDTAEPRRIVDMTYHGDGVWHLGVALENGDATSVRAETVVKWDTQHLGYIIKSHRDEILQLTLAPDNAGLPYDEYIKSLEDIDKKYVNIIHMRERIVCRNASRCKTYES